MLHDFTNLFSDDSPSGPACYWTEHHYQQDQRVFREGEMADSLAVVISGHVRVELEFGELDSDAVLARLGPGEVIGELALLDGGPRSASVIADSPLTLRQLSAEALKRMENELPGAAMEIYRMIGKSAAGKLRHANDRLASALFEAKDPEVEERVAAARLVLPTIQEATDEAIEMLLEQIAAQFVKHAEELAELTVASTGIGNIPHKIEKNHFASQGVLESMRGKSGFGILGEARNGVIEISAPAGVVFGLIPVTNPVATAVFKALVCLKARNASILSFPAVQQQSECGLTPCSRKF